MRPSQFGGEGAFTLVEVLVALVILLIGAYVALRLFPSGFRAIEDVRVKSVAARLAEQEIQRWRLAAGSLPEAIVWARVEVVDDSTVPPTLSLVYSTEYDPNSLVPVDLSLVSDQPNPNWQPSSAYLPRAIIGEVLPIGDVTETVPDPDGVDPDAVGIRVPLCRLRFGPLEHLYAHYYDYDGNGETEYTPNPGGGDPLFLYTTEYERVDRDDFLSGAKDWGRYYLNYDTGTISFDFVSDYPRRFRVECVYLISVAPGAREERRYEMSETVEMITVPAGWDTRPSAAPAQGPMLVLPESRFVAPSPGGAVRSAGVVTITTTSDHSFVVGQDVRIADVTSVGGTEFNGVFVITGVPTSTTFTYDQVGLPDDAGGGGVAGQPVVPLSERVHQAFIHDDDDWSLNGPGYFKLVGDIADPSAYLLCHPGDAGRTVNVDYRVRDWQILVEEQELDYSVVDIAAAPNGAVRDRNVVTITTTTAHGFEVGDIVRVAGVTSAGGTNFNGAYFITDVPNATQFKHEQNEADDDGGGGTAKSPRIRLPIELIKSADYVNPPRQPARDRIIPNDDAMVIIVDTETGVRLPNAEFGVNYNNGAIYLIGNGAAPEPEAGTTYRIYYRGLQDWTVQPMKPAAAYGIIVGGAPPVGYRHALWTEGTNRLEFGPSEVAKSVIANYYMYRGDDPRPVIGELHRVAVENGSALVRLDRTPAWGDIRVRGASMRARVLWAARERTRAASGALSPEKWQPMTVETFLRRE